MAEITNEQIARVVEDAKEKLGGSFAGYKTVQRSVYRNDDTTRDIPAIPWDVQIQQRIKS